MKESEGDWERAAGERKGNIMREGDGRNERKRMEGRVDEGMNGWGNRVSTVRPALGESERKAGNHSRAIFKLARYLKSYVLLRAKV